MSAQASRVQSLFCVRPSTKERPLHPTLPPQLNGGVRVIELPGIDSSDMPIELLAARNIQAMDRFQTTGPYRLAGYLSGGLVAYEMAYQLLASDRAVDFVGLLDS